MRCDNSLLSRLVFLVFKVVSKKKNIFSTISKAYFLWLKTLAVASSR